MLRTAVDALLQNPTYPQRVRVAQLLFRQTGSWLEVEVGEGGVSWGGGWGVVENLYVVLGNLSTSTTFAIK
jgi:hypothetical protein